MVWTVAQTKGSAAVGEGFEAEPAELVNQISQQPLSARACARPLPGGSSFSHSKCPCLRLEESSRRSLGLSNDRGQQPRQQLVVARGDGNVETPARSAVELARSPGSRSGSARQPLEANVDKARLGQPVEVQGGRPARDPKLAGRLVTGDRGVRTGHVKEDRRSDRIIEGRERGDLTGERVGLAPG